MREIGVRELKASLSRTLRAVARGEHLRVTLRGRPIAEIVPVSSRGSDERLRSLVADGRLAPPSRPRPERAPPPARASRAASSVVLAERAAER